jgi:hypothetical protein
MQAERRAFHVFLSMHAHEARPTEDPVVHLKWHGKEDAPFLALDRDDVLDALDPSAELVRWLLEQMRTYDCTKQRIVGLVFDRQTVLSEVLRMPPGAT